MQIKEIDVKRLVAWLSESQPPILIDVRTPEEMAEASLANAIPLPLPTLATRTQEIPSDKEVVFYCRTGNRSGQACLFMMQRGYKNVYNLQGGIVDWVAQGLPVQPLIIK